MRRFRGSVVVAADGDVPTFAGALASHGFSLMDADLPAFSRPGPAADVPG